MTVAERAKDAAPDIIRVINNKQDYFYRQFLNDITVSYAKQLQPVINVSGYVDADLWPVDAISVQPMLEFYEGMYTKVGVSFAKDSFRSLKDITGTWEHKDRADDLSESWLQRVMQYVFNNVAGRITKVTETTKNEIRDIIAISIDKGYGAERSAQLLREHIRRMGIRRARVIARTEILTASNYGQYLGYKSLEIPLQKTWLTARDERVRRSHNGVNGQQRGLDEAFDVNGYKMLHPGDSSLGAPAGELIQCRCVTYSEPV